MPLNAEDGKESMCNGFRHLIRRTLYHSKISAGPADALMVGAVDNGFGAIEGVRETARKRMNHMGLILSVILMMPGGGKVLNDCASEVNIDDLHSFADAQNRFPGTDEEIKKRKLLPVQCAVDLTGTPVRFTEKSRVDVTAAGKKKRIAAGGVRRIQRYQRISAQMDQRIQIIAGLPHVSCNQNFCHENPFYINRRSDYRICRGGKNVPDRRCDIREPAQNERSAV